MWVGLRFKKRILVSRSHVFYKMDDSLVPSLGNVFKNLLILRLSSIFWTTKSKVNGFKLYQVVDFGFTV